MSEIKAIINEISLRLNTKQKQCSLISCSQGQDSWRGYIEDRAARMLSHLSPIFVGHGKVVRFPRRKILQLWLILFVHLCFHLCRIVGSSSFMIELIQEHNITSQLLTVSLYNHTRQNSCTRITGHLH